MPDHSSHPSHPSHPGLPSLASNFDTPRLSSAASIISRPGVEPAVGASRECAPPTGHSNRSRICAVAAAAAENHGRGTLSPPLALATSTTLACPGQTPAPHAILPVLDIPACLDSRAPAPHFDAEPQLFGTLPAALKAELRCLLGRAPGQGAFSAVQAAVNRGLSVTQSCAKTWRHFAHALTCGPKQFRARYDLYQKTHDWISLVNRARAGAAWKSRANGLAEPTLEYIEQRVAAFKRGDAKRQAILSLHRQWRTGLNHHGKPEPIPGYESLWPARNTAFIPRGLSYSNLLRQIKKRARLTAAAAALIQQGSAAALERLPHQLTTRNGLHFLEHITIDDVRVDWLIFDPASGQPCELWLLVARDHATSLVLGYVMHPRTVRADGSKSSIGIRDMKQLAAWILERYPLPPYTSHWTLERGTASLNPGDAAALAEMLPGRIQFHFTSMIGSHSPAGYAEKKKGNSRGKASHESHNRLFHTQSAFIPGQTGNRWDIRPADLEARCDEAAQVWRLRNSLPEHLRGREQYPLLTPAQAREHLTRFCLEQNFRHDHDLEGFAEILEWYDPATRQWQPQSTFRAAASGVSFRRRKESPVERAIQLMAACHGQWTHCPPDAIIAFLTHTARSISKSQVNDAGEIAFPRDGQKLVFAPPAPEHGRRLLASLRAPLLGYLNPDDPAFLHVTDGHGRWLGTWARRARVKAREPELLAQAMRYTAAALQSARQTAARLLEPETAGLETLRAHNSELAATGRAYHDTAAASVPALPDAAGPSASRSAVAATLCALRAERRQTATAEQQQHSARAAEAAEDLLAAMSAFEPEPQQ